MVKGLSDSSKEGSFPLALSNDVLVVIIRTRRNMIVRAQVWGSKLCFSPCLVETRRCLTLDCRRIILPQRSLKNLRWLIRNRSRIFDDHVTETMITLASRLLYLLVKISSFDRVQESPCLCIRCFQFGHWAISCPLVSSHTHRQSERNAGVISQYSADNETSHPGLDDNDNKQIAARLMACTSSKQCLDSSNEYQKSTSLNSENDLKDKQNFPPCNLVDARSAVVPEEMFHAIRKLRMSRADILRWMSSNESLPHLNGLFLRLQLAKLEGGLGGTGYYVAGITGDTAETIRCKSKTSILVDVGGIKSSVGSRYVSNHDFWRTRSRLGGSK
ncbi:hypothetical protein Salat_1749600 [Sesamum alatum]|uniref:CCHC-type domain-containing protein n=1 Tax=Sesamum alatum TaxID=300844 RepID=A0AAE2CKI8_9LAMI|nr:hypothetical protein Salat_1749600 [Sesamum alatum]